MKILIASDHGGYVLKAALIKSRPQIDWVDLGPTSKDSVDYADFADEVARRIDKAPEDRAVLICGSGQGMAMRANKYPHVRAALVWSDEIVKLSRGHNDANILCLGGRFVTEAEALRWLELFLETPFEGGRHSPRVAKVGAPLK